MREPWTGVLVGRMHNEEVTYQELADEAGVVKGYVSQILNGTRTPKKGREKLEGAFESILRRREAEKSKIPNEETTPESVRAQRR